VILGRIPQAQLEEDLPDVALHRLRREEQPLGDRLIGAPFGDERQDLELAARQLIERPAPGEQPRDDRRVDDALARGDALQRGP
jgi:hypothetical protein